MKGEVGEQHGMLDGHGKRYQGIGLYALADELLGRLLKAELPERILHRDLEASDRAEQQLVVVFKEYRLAGAETLGSSVTSQRKAWVSSNILT